MTTSLLRIQAHLDDPKMVIWAHNSHVGDSTATSRGGVSFEHNETWNLGQMTRATFGPDKVWIVGQYTYGGSVTAASHWGGEHRAHTLKPALPDSYEAELHALQAQAGLHGNPFYFATDPDAGGGAGAGDEGSEGREELRQGLVALLHGAARLQRWVSKGSARGVYDV